MAGSSRLAVPRRVVGFHQDEEGHWVAELECGHGQHVRHLPQWQNRPWVTPAAGRRRFLGQTLGCVRCNAGDEPQRGALLWSPDRLRDYLHRNIPLSRAMGVAAVSVSEEAVVLKAPLAPNINHRETVFGGSASALAILAAWSLLHCRLQAEGMDGRLVIQRNTVDYERPMAGEFTAAARLEPAADWARFRRMLAHRGRARIGVAAVLACEGLDAGRFGGDFVAILGGRGHTE